MRRIWLAALGLLLAGCGVQPSGVVDAGPGPTGVAPGFTLYFVDAREQLRPQRRGDRLGTITDALALLLSMSATESVGDPGLHTEITSEGVTRVGVTTSPGLIQLVLPLTAHEVTSLGIDQIVCTALGVSVQSGGSTATRVRLGFTEFTPEPNPARSCPLISPAG